MSFMKFIAGWNTHSFIRNCLPRKQVTVGSCLNTFKGTRSRAHTQICNIKSGHFIVSGNKTSGIAVINVAITDRSIRTNSQHFLTGNVSSRYIATIQKNGKYSVLHCTRVKWQITKIPTQEKKILQECGRPTQWLSMKSQRRTDVPYQKRSDSQNTLFKNFSCYYLRILYMNIMWFGETYPWSFQFAPIPL